MTARQVLRERQYAGADKLAARQRLWRYRPDTGSHAGGRLDLLELAGVESVLDLGCGNGVYLAELRRRGHGGLLVGADLSLGMAYESAAFADATVVVDAEHLPFADAAFDVALAMHMLYHVPRYPAAIAELHRVVGSGGALLVATNGGRHTAEIADVIGTASRAVTGSVWMRPVLSFSIETAEPALRAVYADVRRVEMVETVLVPSAGTVLEYVASQEPEFCGVQPGAQWAEFLDAVRAIVDDRVRRHGAFTVTSHTGTFVCR